MQVLIPGPWVLPDRTTGELPKIQVDNTTDTWIDILDFWCNLGYVATSISGQELVLEYDAKTKEKNAFIRAVWANELCNVAGTQYGEIKDWAAAWMLNPTNYNTEMPYGIPNSSYIDNTDPDNPVEVQRRWNQWGTSRHTHYYIEDWSFEEVTVQDKVFVPTWSWGSNILGTEMNIGKQIVGVNLIDKDVLQKAINQGAATPVVIQEDGTAPLSNSELRELVLGRGQILP